ncbi:MAG: iron ABC transporter permease [Rikenellaceae bacterium]|jgi:iron complex transport system permease protein|nr:iron ABC transporter permease [Rikenellaceae bacterium]
MQLTKKTRNLLFALFAMLLAVFFGLELALGSVSLPLGEVWNWLRGAETDPTARALLGTFRLPKAIVAVTAGAALSASGLQMQTLFRNPLAGPYLLGVSSGASLGVSLFLIGIPVLGLPLSAEWVRNLGVAGAAWVGSAAILTIVFAAATRVKEIMAVLILGMMIGSGATALVEILQYLSPESALKSFVVWTMGSLGGVSSSQLWILVLFVAAGLLLSIFLIKPLNLLLLGESYARTLGQNTRRVRTMIFAGTTLLAGTVTAFCGPIAFIGIAVPHITRMVFRNADHRVLMPASMLIGAVVMLGCDIIAQLPGMDMVLPINTVTALVGIPVVIAVIVKNHKFF